MIIYADNRLLRAGLIGGTLSRHRGNMRTCEAQEPLYRELGIVPQRMLHFHQTHSDTVVLIDGDEAALRAQADPEQEADAWLFTCRGWGGAVLTADCVPLLLWDSAASVFALAHCGWRGVVKRLPYKVARAMQQHGADGPVLGWLGPHIQVCCFEVQADVAAQFSPASLHREGGKIFVNLNLEILLQLQQAGLDPQLIKTPYYCTCGDKENFFSWRRDHVRENLLSFIYKP